MTDYIPQPGSYKDAAGSGFQGVNIEVKARGAQATKEDLEGIKYCKYHHAFNHTVKTCWPFKNMLQEKKKIKSYWIPKGQIFEAKKQISLCW